MIETDAATVSILIVTTRPAELDAVTRFLCKRNYQVTIKVGMRDGMAHLTQHRPDWVLLSINLSPVISKYVTLLKQTFKTVPILFTDTIDRQSLSCLDQCDGPIINCKLTGPSIQMKLAREIADAEAMSGAKHRLPSRQTFGVRRSDFAHVHVKGESRNETDGGVIVQKKEQLSHRFTIVSTAKPEDLVSAGRSAKDTAAGDAIIQAAIDKLAQSDKSAAVASVPNFIPVREVTQLNVVVLNENHVRGYLAMGSSLSSAAAEIEALKIRDQMVESLGHQPGTKDKFFGVIKVQIESLPQWAGARASIVKRHSVGQGEMLTCFVPEENPLPHLKASGADPEKYEVLFKDIPTEVPLPCPMYVHLPENGKFVCLIKTDGYLSAKQQERLIKMGVPSLLIGKDDLGQFYLFYIREKLTAAEASLAIPA